MPTLTPAMQPADVEAVFAVYGWKSDFTDDEILEKLLALNLESQTWEVSLEDSQVMKTPKKTSEVCVMRFVTRYIEFAILYQALRANYE